MSLLLMPGFLNTGPGLVTPGDALLCQCVCGFANFVSFKPHKRVIGQTLTGLIALVLLNFTLCFIQFYVCVSILHTYYLCTQYISNILRIILYIFICIICYEYFTYYTIQYVICMPIAGASVTNHSVFIK